MYDAEVADRVIADRVIRELQAKIRTRELVIDTLRGMLHTAWNLTNNYEKAEEG